MALSLLGLIAPISLALNLRDVSTPTISKDQAVELITSCKISSIYRDNQQMALHAEDPFASKSQYYVDAADFEAVETAASTAEEKCGFEVGLTDIRSTSERQASRRPVDISATEASALLQECKLQDFFYTESQLGEGDEFKADRHHLGL